MKTHKSKILPILIAVFGLTAAPAVLAQSCCGGQSATQHTGCDMPGMAQHTTSAGHEGHAAMTAGPASASPAVFMPPVQSVYDGYVKVHAALAQDSLDGVATVATAIAKAVQGDSMKMLSPNIAQQAEALAKAKDLAAARAAFKPLSESLIQYVKAQKIPPGHYYEVYCSMAKASWLQTDKTIMNPYMGKAMIHCGQIKT